MINRLTFFPEDFIAARETSPPMLCATRDSSVAGSFEIPLLCDQLIMSKGVDAVIALGVIVQGDTHHARLIAEQAAAGIMQIQLEHGCPIAFEVLYVDDIKDAIKRSTGNNGKGVVAARIVLKTLATLKDLR